MQTFDIVAKWVFLITVGIEVVGILFLLGLYIQRLWWRYSDRQIDKIIKELFPDGTD